MPARLPHLIPIRQRFAPFPLLDLRTAILSQLESKLAEARHPQGARVAVAVGSRGISNLRDIVALVVGWLRQRGARPFIVPAMGSHGGATREGQTAILGDSGISEEALRVPIRASMQVARLGQTDDGVEFCFSAQALASDGIVV